MARPAASLAGDGRGPLLVRDLFISLECLEPGADLARTGMRSLDWAMLATPVGRALFAQVDGRLAALAFQPGGNDAAAVAALGRRWPGFRLRESAAALIPYRDDLADRLRGRIRRPLALTLRGTHFQLRVWEALLRIPEGLTMTCRELAESLGGGATARAVGAIARRNPIACLIPSHRLVRDGADPRADARARPPEPVLLALEDARTGR
jgi:AraC family transcriptional regulator of adaptative response/methylated-DNA-[protein]-cysteine methyltransferase